MPRLTRKAADAPHRLWVLLDTNSGSPIESYISPDDIPDLMSDEMVYEYTIHKEHHIGSKQKGRK